MTSVSEVGLTSRDRPIGSSNATPNYFTIMLYLIYLVRLFLMCDVLKWVNRDLLSYLSCLGLVLIVIVINGLSGQCETLNDLQSFWFGIYQEKYNS